MLSTPSVGAIAVVYATLKQCYQYLPPTTVNTSTTSTDACLMLTPRHAIDATPAMPLAPLLMPDVSSACFYAARHCRQLYFNITFCLLRASALRHCLIAYLTLRRYTL